MQIVDVPQEREDVVHYVNKRGYRTGMVALIEWVCGLFNKDGVYEIKTSSGRTMYVKNNNGRWEEYKF